MTQDERLEFLLGALLAERPGYRAVSIPAGCTERKRLFRALCNVRPPLPANAEFLRVQDEYLLGELAARGVIEADSLPFDREGLCIWQGDITRLRADAIVNAANDRLLGCFVPGHGCIDNAIHSAAGVQLRLACDGLLAPGETEPTGQARLTPGFNLPGRFVLHTVGPIIMEEPTAADCRALASCYRSCLELAVENGLETVAFCCISTGEFHFPRERAAAIAVRTVREFRRGQGGPCVVFDVFRDDDREIYQALLKEGSLC